MTLIEVLTDLESYGSETTKRTLIKHGAKEPFWGVKVQDLKKILKKTKKDHELSLQLYDTGNSDAMYLAGLMADEKQISKEQLQQWVQKAYWYYLSEYAVAQLAAETAFGWELGLEWIESQEDGIAAAGWATLSNVISYLDNDVLDIEKIVELLERVKLKISNGMNREKYTMNGFVIAVGSYIPELNSLAKELGDVNGKIEVNVGNTACKVPVARAYIEKIEQKGRLGKKRKVARC